MRFYGLLVRGGGGGGGGGQVCIHVQSMWQVRKVRGMLPRDFGPFIRRNLVESGTVFAQT